MVKEKVTLGNEKVSHEMAGWNAFSLWPTHKTVFRFQYYYLFEESGFHVSVESYTIQCNYVKTIPSLLN